MADKTRGTTDFTPEASMVSAVAAAKSRRVPVGGDVPLPKMPRLDQAPPNKPLGVQGALAAQRILTPDQHNKLVQEGKFVPGVGSGFAANQPALKNLPTDTEGNELPIDPKLAPRPPGSGLREETVAGLDALNAANAKETDDEALKNIASDIKDAEDVFETDDFGNRVKSLLENKKRKETIEARCEPLSFEDLLLNGTVHQKVPIIPGKFEPTYRSVTGEENVEILRMMGSIRGPDNYFLDILSIYNLTAGLHALNTKILPNHLDKNGDFNEEMFRAKYKVLLKMAIPILSDLSVNFRWFAKRVQKLTVIDEIKSF